jgi:ketosteroid isomerase-like protein
MPVASSSGMTRLEPGDKLPPMQRVAAILIGLLLFPVVPSAQNDDRAGVTATVEAFYGAMKKGDAAAVMRTVAPDAVFLEGGKQETRAEYETGHLPADIEFEKAVDGKRGPLTVTVNGDTAWVTGMADYVGTFQGKPVNFESAQLMVLTRTGGRWLIRSVHWSARRR